MSIMYPFLKINVYRNSLFPLEEYLRLYLWTDKYEKLVHRVAKVTGTTEGVLNLDCREPILHEKHKFWGENRKIILVDKHVNFTLGVLSDINFDTVRILDVAENRFKNVNNMGLTLPWYTMGARKPRIPRARKSANIPNPSTIP